MTTPWTNINLKKLANTLPGPVICQVGFPFWETGKVLLARCLSHFHHQAVTQKNTMSLHIPILMLSNHKAIFPKVNFDWLRKSWFIEISSRWRSANQTSKRWKTMKIWHWCLFHVLIWGRLQSPRRSTQIWCFRLPPLLTLKMHVKTCGWKPRQLS